jgi:hypothetical protein
MTDPERISKRSHGLAAQLLQAGAEEQPSEIGMQRTLAALGAGAALATTSAAAAGTAKATGAAGAGAGGAGFASAAAGGAMKAVSATLLVKWIGIGVVGGIGLAGAAAVATSPTPPPSSGVRASVRPVVAVPAQAAHDTPRDISPSTAVEVSTAEAAPAAPVTPRVSVAEPMSTAPMELGIGAPLAAEVAYVDRARALLAAGRSDQGLAMLLSYERQFAEARLLPEVLFLRLETCDRLGRKSEARAAAQRLLEGFPKSPHAARARKFLRSEG